MFHPNHNWALMASPLCAIATIAGILAIPKSSAGNLATEDTQQR